MIRIYFTKRKVRNQEPILAHARSDVLRPLLDAPGGRSTTSQLTVGNLASAIPVINGGGGGGVGNVVEDLTPQLGGNLDLNSFTVGAASAADLTKLNALTSTSTELNYTDGVTSAIQTQIDGKQATDAELTAIAGLTSAADKGIQFTGAGTAGTYDLTTAGKALLDDANAAAQIATLGLDADIATLALPASTTISAYAKSFLDDADEATLKATINLEANTDFYAPSGTDVAIADGGTGASSAAAAIAALGGLPTAGGTMTGNVILAENASVALDPAGSADGKYTGITITATAGYTQAFGDLVYLDPTDSRWEACDANSAAGADGDSRGIVGIVVSAGTDGTACTILLNGVIRADAKFPSFTINNPIYISETAGSVTQTQPTTTDVVIRVVGFAITADEMYFNPSNDYITHI